MAECLIDICRRVDELNTQIAVLLALNESLNRKPFALKQCLGQTHALFIFCVDRVEDYLLDRLDHTDDSGILPQELISKS